MNYNFYQDLNPLQFSELSLSKTAEADELHIRNNCLECTLKRSESLQG